MSGGSMDYLHQKVMGAYFRENTPERKALRIHMNRLADALCAVEWNDSGDGADDESGLIREAIGDRIILEASIQAAKEAHKDLGDRLAHVEGHVEGSWLSKEMQTPAKGFPAIKDHHVDFNGVKVSLWRREPGDGVNPTTASLEPVDAWEPRIGDIVKWAGCRRVCTVKTVKAGPTRSWTLIKERKGERRTYVVKDVSELVPYELEEDEE